MRVTLKILTCSAVLALFAMPASALSPRHEDFRVGGGGGEAVVLDVEPAGAVPEPAAALVFGVGTLIIATQLRRRQAEQ